MWKTLRAALRVSHISIASTTTDGPASDYQMALFSIVKMQGRERQWPSFRLSRCKLMSQVTLSSDLNHTPSGLQPTQGWARFQLSKGCIFD